MTSSYDDSREQNYHGLRSLIEMERAHSENSRPLEEIAYVTMVRDEEDVIKENLEWHYSLGFRYFFIIDNRSRDYTRELIESFRVRTNAIVHLLIDYSEVNNQYKNFNAAFRFIETHYDHVQWMFPIDADEFLCPARPLWSIIQSVDSCVGSIIYPRIPYLPTSIESLSGNGKFFERLEYIYIDNPKTDLYRHYQFHPFDPPAPWDRKLGINIFNNKVAIRAHYGIRTVRGNHYIEGCYPDKKKNTPVWEFHPQSTFRWASGVELGLHLREFPYRSVAQIERKAKNRAKSRKADKKPATPIHEVGLTGQYEEFIANVVRSEKEGIRSPLPLHRFEAICPAEDNKKSRHQVNQRLSDFSRSRVQFLDVPWQGPNITEKHAAERIQQFVSLPANVVYVAAPWATLIDSIHRKSPEANRIRDSFFSQIRRNPEYSVVVTVCQHAYMLDYIDLFKGIGITDIFWSHMEKDTPRQIDGINLFPFPLYPVNVSENRSSPRQASSKDKRWLASFVGASAKPWYKNNFRDQMANALKDDPRIKIELRDTWHFDNSVYGPLGVDLAKADDAAQSAKAAEYVKALEDSVFCLCPSGVGANTIRLWEAIESACVPIVISGQWCPPGDERLWEDACIFSSEDNTDINSLLQELEDLAGARDLYEKRQSVKQLRLLYGRDNFVNDLHIFLQSAGAKEYGSSRGLEWLSRVQFDQSNRKYLRTAAVSLNSYIFMGDPALVSHINSNTLARKKVDQLSDRLGKDDPNALMLGEALKSGIHASPFSRIGNYKKRPKHRVCLEGAHSNRTIFAYKPFRDILQGTIDVVHEQEHADWHITGFSKDFYDEIAEDSSTLSKLETLRLGVISEEPLWDTLWTRSPEKKELELPNGVSLRQWNSINSDFLQFKKIPYFILTDYSYSAVYAGCFNKFLSFDKEKLLEYWRTRPSAAAFVAEYRMGDKYKAAWSNQSIVGLSSYRTEVAIEVMNSDSSAVCFGAGWGGSGRRQSRTNWHLDKLARLSEEVRFCSAIENTLHPYYLTEKLFDAFAIGAIPIVYAADNSLLFELIDERAVLNLYCCSPQEAAKRVDEFEFTSEVAGAWLHSLCNLNSLMTDITELKNERKRFADKALDFLEL